MRSLLLILAGSLLLSRGFGETTNTEETPISRLMITGGCCHDYEAQKKILSEGISARANVTWTIIHEGESDAKTHKFSVYEKPDWTSGFDVVLHNECSGLVSNAT